MIVSAERIGFLRRLSRPVSIAVALSVVALVLLALGTALLRRSAGETLAVNTSGAPGALSSAVAADFSFTGYDGSPLRLSDLRGRGVVLNFWASWCVPCREEAPLLARVAREYEPAGVQFVGISVWDAESDARAFIGRFGVGYPNGPDEGGRIAIDYGVSGLPETFFIRPDGSMERRWVGPLNEARLRAFVEEIRPGGQSDRGTS